MSSEGLPPVPQTDQRYDTAAMHKVAEDLAEMFNTLTARGLKRREALALTETWLAGMLEKTNPNAEEE